MRLTFFFLLLGYKKKIVKALSCSLINIATIHRVVCWFISLPIPLQSAQRTYKYVGVDIVKEYYDGSIAYTLCYRIS